MTKRVLTSILVLFILSIGVLQAQRHAHNGWRGQLIIPHAHVRPQQQQVKITSVDARVRIVEQVATTELTINLHNPTARQLEATLLVPVPDKVSIRHFDFLGKGLEPSAKLMPHGEASKIYRDIVSQMRDPAILEFAGLNLIRSSVFPVPANGKQILKIVYEQILEADGNRIDYVIPRSESIAYNIPWKISMAIGHKTQKYSN